jgi:hypothetical protein
LCQSSLPVLTGCTKKLSAKPDAPTSNVIFNAHEVETLLCMHVSCKQVNFMGCLHAVVILPTDLGLCKHYLWLLLDCCQHFDSSQGMLPDILRLSASDIVTKFRHSCHLAVSLSQLLHCQTYCWLCCTLHKAFVLLHVAAMKASCCCNTYIPFCILACSSAS